MKQIIYIITLLICLPLFSQIKSTSWVLETEINRPIHLENSMMLGRRCFANVGLSVIRNTDSKLKYGFKSNFSYYKSKREVGYSDDPTYGGWDCELDYFYDLNLNSTLIELSVIMEYPITRKLILEAGVGGGWLFSTWRHLSVSDNEDDLNRDKNVNETGVVLNSTLKFQIIKSLYLSGGYAMFINTGDIVHRNISQMRFGLGWRFK